MENYPYKFIQYDALDFLWEENINNYDLIHASPPCQAHSWSTRSDRKRKYKDYIPELRSILIDKRCDYVIENVPGANLFKPIILEGFMFDLPLKRRRLFECSFSCEQPKMVQGRNWVTIAGNGGNAISYKLSDYKLAMGINWIITKKEITQAIPPAYTKYIGNEYITSL